MHSGAQTLRFFGHNCFLVAGQREQVLIDPWLSDEGAFFGSWRQWPVNAHLRDEVMALAALKPTTVYVTHEHQDHFDVETLKLLAAVPNLTFVIPNFRDKFLCETLVGFGAPVVELREGQRRGDEIELQVFITDLGHNHDSALLVRCASFVFFDQNDCKIFDRLQEIRDVVGEIDIYSVQFSGASWHPVCYEMDEATRREISRHKTEVKFNNVLIGIETLKPVLFAPAAGPAFFPFHEDELTLSRDTIFTHQDVLAEFLASKGVRNVIYPRPGDIVSESSNRTPIPMPSKTDLEAYRREHVNPWQLLKREFDSTKLERAIRARFMAIQGIEIPAGTPPIVLKWGNSDEDQLIVDLVAKKCFRGTIEGSYVRLRADETYFALMADPAVRWQDIYLSLRASVRREPDRFDNHTNLFLFSDLSNIRDSMLSSDYIKQERIAIEHEGKCYTINRYCAHQGADLSRAAINADSELVCPRHGWRFKLTDNGMCAETNCSIDAVVADCRAPSVANRRKP